MGLFSGSSRRSGRNRHSAATDNTMTDYDHGVNHGVNHGTHHGMGHDANHSTDRDYNHGAHNGNSYGNGHGMATDAGYGHHNKHEKFGRKSRHDKPYKQKRPLFDMHSGHFNRRPSFGTWIKHTWLDILTMIIMGAIGLGVYFADPAPSRSFPVIFQDGSVVYPQFAYPLRKEIIPIWAAALLAALVPIFVFLCMQIRIKSFWDVNNAVIGLLYSLIGAAVFQVFVKWLIGGLRPHFLDVCQPSLERLTQGGNGYRGMMFTPEICTGDRKKINDSLESMPSGHSTAAWAGFLYLYFYLNAKLKVFSNHHPAFWKLIALYAPLLGATLITGALTIDEFHNWYDCLAGAIIGSVFAISAYRMCYASVWDFRFNHIPLTRHTPFSYGAGSPGAGGFETCVFTHKAGWGYEEAYGGAPFDSGIALRSLGGGVGGGVPSNVQSETYGHKGMGHRHGDVEHNAATTTPTTAGLGHHHDRSSGLGHNNTHDSGLGHHNNRDSGLAHNHTTGMGTGVGTGVGTGIGTGLGHHGTHNTGLGHQNNHGNGLVHDRTTGVGTGIGTGVGTGLGHHGTHNTGLGHHNNQGTGLVHDRTTGVGSGVGTGMGTGLGHNNTHESGFGHHNQPDSGLTHNHNTGIGQHQNNSGYNNYDNNNTSTNSHMMSNLTHPNQVHDTTTSGYNDDYGREGRSTVTGDNRYRSHRKSLERKALASEQSRNEGVF